MSHPVLRLKNDTALKSRLLYTVLGVNPSYVVKDYQEEPDPTDKNYCIISFTSYEKGPYRPIRKLLNEFIKNNEIECLNDSSGVRSG